MYWGYIEQHWSQLRESIHDHWQELSDDDIDEIAGRFDTLVEFLSRRCRIAPAEAELSVQAWLDEVHPPPPWRIGWC